MDGPVGADNADFMFVNGQPACRIQACAKPRRQRRRGMYGTAQVLMLSAHVLSITQTGIQKGVRCVIPVYL